MRYESTDALEIPDDDSAGVTGELVIDDDYEAASVQLELDVTHTWVGDLVITLSHDGVEAVVWEKAGGDGHDIHQTFGLSQFAGKSVVDTAAQATGTVDGWAMIVTKERFEVAAVCWSSGWWLGAG